MIKKRVIVVGAGLAGLSCAHALSRHYEVVVLEARPWVGGRTASWDENGMMVESGLHRYLGFYAALPKLIRAAGLDLRDVVFWEDEIEIRLPDGPSAVFGASVHKPLKTMTSFMGNHHFLSLSHKWQLTQMFTRGLVDYFRQPEALDKITVSDYARRCGVERVPHDRVLIPLTEGIFFTPPERYSTYALFGLIGPYLPHFWRMRIGGFKGGMTEVMAGPIAAAVRSRGGAIKTGAVAERLIIEDAKVTGVVVNGEKLAADHVVVASSLAGAQRLIKPGFSGQDWAKGLLSLPSTPAVTLQLKLDQPMLPKDRTTFGPGTSWAAFAEQSRTTFSRDKGRLSIILSSPQRFIDMDHQQVLAEAIADGQKLGVHLAGHVIDYRKVVLPMDFYSLEAGNNHRRPPQSTPVPGLSLAGDYTYQPYLGTMEGAVVSGSRAADRVRRVLA
jgi:15-cis-phytoene desaturase